MTTTPTTLNASAITRRLNRAGIPVVSHRHPSTPHAVRVIPLDDDGATAARAVVAELIRAGYDAARTSAASLPAVIVTLPEPVIDEPAEAVRCEHVHDGGRVHPLADECVHPHLIGPTGTAPRPVGHPLTPHD